MFRDEGKEVKKRKTTEMKDAYDGCYSEMGVAVYTEDVEKKSGMHKC